MKNKGIYARYGLPGVLLAALGLPFYVYVPLWLVEARGYSFAAVAVAFALARVLDACSDLPIGWWADRRQSRWVPLLGWLLIVASAYWLPLVTEFAPLVVTLSLLFVGWSMVVVPWMGMPVAAPVSLRANLNASREVGLFVGTILGLLLPALFGVSNGLLWSVLVALLFALWTLPVFGLNREQPVLGLRSLFSLLASDRSSAVLLAAWVLNAFANAVPGVVLLLYVREVLAAESWLPAFLGFYFVAALLGAVIATRLATRFSVLSVWRSSILMASVFFIPALWLGSDDKLWFAAVCVATGFCVGADNVMPSILQTQWASLTQRKQAKICASQAFGLWTMGQKLAMGAAVVVAFLVLGLVPGSESQQGATNLASAEAIAGVYVLVPVAVKLILFAGLATKPWKQALLRLEPPA